MSLKESFDKLAKKCKIYQQKVDKYELWYKQPIQGHYVWVNKILQAHLDSKLQFEAIAAGEQSFPGGNNFTPARRLFYDLQEVVPPFLAGRYKTYYHLQHYRIDCMHLLKTFSYSTFKGDWKKSRELIVWMGEINNKLESYNASSSFNKSLDDIKNLGDLSSLSDGELRALEEEIANVNALLMDNSDLLSEFSAEDLAFIEQASSHLDQNKSRLKGLPKVDDTFKYEEPPALETLSYRCHQLAVTVDNYKNMFEDGTSTIDIGLFTKDLRNGFDMQIGPCAIVYNALQRAFGAYKVFSISRLCNFMQEILEQFSNDKFLEKEFSGGFYAKHMEIHRGIPDPIMMESYLILATQTPLENSDIA